MNEKNLSCDALTKRTSVNHHLLIIRTVIIFLFTCVFISVAEKGITENTKVTPIENNTNLKEVLNKIEQQDRTVTGKVTDINGDPLPGVTVLVKGTSKGTITDEGGYFTLSGVSGNATLHFSFVGFQTQDLPVGGRSTIDVTLLTDLQLLDEIVVVGYGTQKKADLTGSIAVIDGKDLAKKTSTVNLTDALQGTMAGVTVTRNSSQPGTAGQIRIRGITTIGDSNPLVIIDGIPGSLANVKSDDVESISVLKDAASASIYGSKAASGVILVTTKRGRSGQIELNYNGEFGYTRPYRVPRSQSAVPYMKMANELLWNDNNNKGSEYPKYSKELIENYYSLHNENPDLYPDTDWSEYFRKSSPRQSHSLNYSVGEKNYTSHGSLTYDKVEAIVTNLPYQNFTARINNDVNFNKIITGHIDLQYMNSHDQRLVGGNPRASLLALEPLGTAYWSDGRVATFRNNENHLASFFEGGTNNIWENTISGRIALDITPIENLKITGIFAPNFSFYKSKLHRLKIPTTDFQDPNVITGYADGYNFTNLYENRNDGKSYTSQILANYSTSIGKNNLNFLGGYEYYYSFYESLGASREHYAFDNYPYLNIGPLDYRDNSGSASEYASQSFFGRILYDYNRRYLVQLNSRLDGSSRFHPDYRYGFFPSVSLGWVLSEESFFKTDPISFFKLRASYGTLGNERIGNYPYQSTIAFNYALLYSGSNVSTTQTAYVPRYAIKDISWETTSSFDIGLDAYFFDNKLQLVMDYYKKRTSDMLLALQIPSYIGLANPNQNTGKMDTKGWEIDIRYRNNFGDLNYSISGNISDFKSKMGYLGGTEFLGDQVKLEGSEFNEWYGYKANGIYQTEEEVANSAVINKRVKPGDIRYVDISGPDGVPDGAISPEYDKVLLGGSLPRFEYGGNIQLDYKNIDLSIFFQGIGKQNSYLSTDMVRPLFGGVLHVPVILEGNYWSKYNTEEQNKNVRYPRLSEIAAGAQDRNSGNNYVTSDYWLFNGRYFRLKNIILGYSFPENLTRSIGINNLRVYTNISDLFSIDNFPDGWDPESAVGSYFITQSFTIGLSAKF